MHELAITQSILEIALKAAVEADYRAVNPEGPLFQVSCRTGEGMEALAGRLKSRIRSELARASEEAGPAEKA